MKASKKSGTTSRAERRRKTETLVLGAMLTALVIILQLLGQFVHIGSVASVSLVLIPIVIGAALCGPSMGAWLGLVFSIVVLCQPDTQAFYNLNAVGTVIIVLAKGVLCGYVAGLIYRVMSKLNSIVAVFTAAAVCPIINSGIFAIGCFTFFFNGISAQGSEAGYSSTVAFIFLAYIGLNFVFEFVFNIVLSPAIIKLVDIAKKQLAAKK